MRIVVDDVGDLPAELIEKHNIYVVPINIHFGSEEFLSGVTMSQPEFFAKAKHVTSANFPKTSQPTPHQFTEHYKKLIAEGETEIFTVTVGHKLSGTHESAVLASRELEGQATFHIFDSFAGSAPQGYMALEAARMAEAGATAVDIQAKLEEMKESFNLFFTIDSLEYAVKGGRVGSIKSLVASLLNIKPILYLHEGEIVEAGRVRTRKKALTHIVNEVYERVGDKPVKLAIIHANAPEDARKLSKIAREKFNATEFFLTDMAVSVAVNLGPGALGLLAIPA